MLSRLRSPAAFLGFVLLLVLFAVARSAAADTTTTDPDDPYEDGYAMSTDVRTVAWDTTSTPGTVIFTAELDFAANAALSAVLFLDTNRDGKTDDAVEISQNGSNHPNVDGSGGQLRYKLRHVTSSTDGCQSYSDGYVDNEDSTYATGTATRRIDGATARTTIRIPIALSDLGNPSSFKWAVMGSSQASSQVQYDVVPDAANGATTPNGDPADPRDPGYGESDFFYCSNGGTSYGYKLRIAQGETVSLAGPPPQVSISQDPASGRPGDTLSFTARLADGRAVDSYSWDLDGDGAYGDATGQTVSKRFASGGRRFVRVKVRTSDGQDAIGERSVDIVDRAPSVTVAQSPALARPNRAVTLTANATDDGQIASYSWDLDGDGGFGDATGSTAATSYRSEGTQRVAVKVTDDAGNVTTATRDVEVAERAPTMTLGTSKENPAAKEKFTLTADVSDDGDVDPAKIQWGFDLNPNDSDPYSNATGRTWTLSFGVAGTYKVKARYTDESGKTVRSVITVVVPNKPPVFREIRVRKQFTPDQPSNAAPLVKGEPMYLEALYADDNLTLPKVEWDLDGDGKYNDATGQKVSYTFPSAGSKKAAVRLTDEQGAVTYGELAFEVRESATAACAGRVDADGMRAVGCFTAGPNGSRITKEPLKINGLDVEPAARTTVQINPRSGLVETGDGTVRIRAGSVVLFDGRWKMDPNCDRTKTECLAFKADVPAVSNVKGLPIKGEAEVYFTPTGTRVKVNVDVFGQAGFGVTAAANLVVLDQGGLQLDDLEVRSPSLPLPKNLEIGQFFIKYQGALKRWSGGGYIVLPTPQFTRLSGDFAFSEISGFERAHAEVDGLNVPIDEFGTIYLQRIALTLEIKGSGPSLRVRIGGGVGASLGPRVGGVDAMTLDGDFLFTFGWPFGMDVEGRLSVAGYDIMGASAGARSNGTMYASGSIGFGLPFPRGAKGARKDGTKVKVSKFDPNADVFNPFQIITVKGTANAWVEPNAFNVDASIYAKVLGIPLVGARGLLSSKGVAGCGEIIGIKGGFGYDWQTERTDTFGNSCDLSPWAATRTLAPVDGEGSGRLPTRSARAVVDSGPRDLDVAAGQKALVLKLEGQGGAPVVRLTSPSGRSWEVPADGSAVKADDWFTATNPQTHETFLGVRTPAPGRWHLEPLPDSPALASVDSAAVLPEPSVRATVSGTGAQRTIRYSLKPIPGQTVEFAEYGSDVHRVVGKVTGAAGELHFAPLAGSGLDRKLVALVKQNGLMRTELRVATFTATKPAGPATARRLRARRAAHRRLITAWAPVPGAVRYRVIAQLSDGRGVYQRTKGTRAIFKAVARGDAARVDVRAIDALGLSSSVRSVIVRAGQPYATASGGPTGGCVSRRRFTIHLRTAIRNAQISVNGKAAKTLKGSRLRGDIDLRGLPKGVVRVRITGQARSGRRVFEERVYRTCVPG